MKKLIGLLACIMLIGVSVSFAQTKQVTGTVTDKSDGSPLPGVSVAVKGTSTGTATDINGKFSLKVGPKDILVFSFVGMKTQEVTVGNKTVFNVKMESDRVAVEEVIVTGYGNQKKSSFTGSAEVVDDTKLKNLQKANPMQALEGAMAGVQIFNTSGQPGSSPTIRIRGVSSLNASKDPLIVVDGLIYDGNLANIPNGDIESMVTLKDAAATALYGARGGNGVIVITTKQGKSGRTDVEIRASVGFSERGIKEYSRLDQKEYYEMAWESLRNYADYQKAGGGSAEFDNPAQWASNNLVELLGTNCYNVADNQLVDPVTGKLNPNAELLWDNNLEDIMYRTGVKEEYSASVRGGFKGTKFFMSVGRLNQKGILEDSDYSRNNARINVDSKINEWFTAGFNIGISEGKSSYTKQVDDAASAVFTTMRNRAPIYTEYQRNEAGEILYDDAGDPKLDYGTGLNGDRVSKYNSGTSILSRRYDPNITNRNNFIGNFYGQIEPIKGLKAKIVYSKSQTNYDQLSYTNMIYGWGREYGGGTSRSFTNAQTKSFKQFISYEKEIDAHSFNITGVHENYEYSYSSMDGYRQGFPVPGLLEFKAAATTKDLSSEAESYATEAYLLKGDYEYNGKYYANASFRYEGSSRFHKDERWGKFWAIGLAWRISKEDFMQNLDWIDNMRVKVSYGTNGNDNIGGYYPYQALFTTGRNNTSYSGVRVNSFANPKLTWEKQKKFNTGIDATLFNRLVDVQIEYFNNETTDLLFDRPIPNSSGLTTIPMNIGALRNSGFEYTVTVHPCKNEFKWDFSMNLTHYKNEVTELAENLIRHGNQAYQVGKSAYEYYMFESAGINPDTGNYLWYKDIYKTDDEGEVIKDKYDNKLIESKETTEIANDATEKWLGSSLPDFYGGFSNSLSYKGLNLRIDCTYSVGGDMIDYAYDGLMHRGGMGFAWHKDILNRWTPDNTETDVPKLVYNSTQTGIQNEDRYMIDASYLNISNISLSYQLPESITKKFFDKTGIKGIMVSAAVENLHQFNKRKGLNAMVNMSGGLNADRYSLLRSYSFGIVLNF